MLIGRKSVFISAVILIVNALGLCMVYFIVFGDTTSQLVATLSGTVWKDNFYTQRFFYDLILGAVLLPVILKKELAELAWVSYVLFVCLGIFVVLNFYILVIDPRFEPPEITSEVLVPKARWSTISSLAVTLLAFSY